jgi:regulator of RNase E activity RraA
MEIHAMGRPPKDLIEGFRSVGTSTIGDLLDALGINGVMSGIKAVREGFTLVGPAVTIKEVSGDVGSYTLEDFCVGRVIDAAQAEDVLVFDNSGKEISTWGGLAAKAAKIKGIAGIVVDGGCRDADQIVALDFPTFSRHVTPTTGKTRIKILEMNRIVECGGVRVQAGDIVVADRTGVVVVPQEMAGTILEQAREAEKREALFAQELERGRSFAEAQQKTGSL